MDIREIERVLAENVSVALSAEEMDELCHRLQTQAESVRLLRALPLLDEEPAPPTAAEDEA